MPEPAPDAPLVLIVDDNDRNRKLARDVLLAAGFRTLEATTGTEGIVCAVKYLPDVILMDLRLPDIDGIDAARRVAADARTAGIPIVAFSSLPLEGDDDWLEGVDFVGCLSKPIDVGAFPNQIRHFCRA